MQQPEAYIGGAGELFDGDGVLVSDETRTFLDKFIGAFENWVTTVRRSAELRSFEDFMKEREAIAYDYVNGEPDSLAAIVTHRDPATFFSPKGDHQLGADPIAQRYTADAKGFSKPGESRLEILQAAASGGLAFWTGLQHANVHLGGKAEPTPMTLRITEVFRFEDAGWKLVHRHADMAKDNG
jgi:ketosteroid isomerase-like protein